MSTPKWTRIVLVGLLCVLIVATCLALTYFAAVLGNITATPSTPIRRVENCGVALRVDADSQSAWTCLSA